MSENLEGSQQQQSGQPPEGAIAENAASSGEADLSIGQRSGSEAMSAGSENATAGDAGEGAREPVAFDQDWRAHLAGDDEGALSELSRVKSPQDLVQQVISQKKELSKRSAGGPFPTDGDEASQNAWREHHGVPKEGTLDAYGVKAPEGYEMGEVETKALGDYAEMMHSINAPPQYVQQSVDQFFAMQEANQQAMVALNDEVEEKWHKDIDQHFGSEREVMVKAADAFLKERIEDKTVRNTLFAAQLPGGGTLGNHPEFIKLAAELALQNGYNDRIEANAMEAQSGKSLEDERTDIMKLYDTDRPAYDRKQERLVKIDQLLNARRG